MASAVRLSVCNRIQIRSLVCVYVSVSLSGCMSGGGSSDQVTSALEAKRLAAEQMFMDFNPPEYTSLSMVPTTGSATYDGFVSGVLSNTSDDVTDTLIGDLSINVSFDGSEMISGVADGFLDDSGNHLSGEIILSGGELDRAGDPNVDATLTFDGSGQLTAANGDTIAIDADFAGDFLGDEFEAVGGEALAQVTVDGATQSFGGSFIATR